MDKHFYTIMGIAKIALAMVAGVLVVIMPYTDTDKIFMGAICALFTIMAVSEIGLKPYHYYDIRLINVIWIDINAVLVTSTAVCWSIINKGMENLLFISSSAFLMLTIALTLAEYNKLKWRTNNSAIFQDTWINYSVAAKFIMTLVAIQVWLANVGKDGSFLLLWSAGTFWVLMSIEVWIHYARYSLMSNFSYILAILYDLGYTAVSIILVLLHDQSYQWCLIILGVVSALVFGLGDLVIFLHDIKFKIKKKKAPRKRR